MSDTPSGPREGHGLEGSLPPCFRYAVFEGCRAIMHLNCPEHTNPDSRYAHISVAQLREWESDFGHAGRQFSYPWGGGKNVITYADDSGEAESLWLEAYERLRKMA